MLQCKRIHIHMHVLHGCGFHSGALVFRIDPYLWGGGGPGGFLLMGRDSG